MKLLARQIRLDLKRLFSFKLVLALVLFIGLKALIISPEMALSIPKNLVYMSMFVLTELYLGILDLLC